MSNPSTFPALRLTSLAGIGLLLLACRSEAGGDASEAGDCVEAGCTQAMDALPASGAAGSSSSDAMTSPGDGQTDRRVAAVGGAPVCLSRGRGDELRPIALYMMLDGSGSMEELAGTTTKWDAVTAGLRSFVAETAETELQLGLQFFPQPKPGSSFTCTSHEDCGPDGGPCLLSTCTNAQSLTACRTDADCAPAEGGNTCEPFGICSGSDPDAPVACLMNGSPCAGGLGSCEDFERTCTNATSCDPAMYATPAVEMGPMSSNATLIEQAVAGRQPEGLTPIAGALQGALDHAREWARSRPEHETVVVLVTDGLPSICAVDGVAQTDPAAAIAEVLAIASAASTSSEVPIRTFVIGVFAPGNQTSIDNVDAIARAGGTASGHLIDPSGDVEQQFLTQLRSVRDRAAPCQVELTSESALDFHHADVNFDGGTGNLERHPNLDSPTACAENPEGWHYDVPVDQSVPRYIVLCPSLCESVRATPGAEFSIEVACAVSD